MARIDDYFEAKRIAVNALSKKDSSAISKTSGLERIANTNTFRVPFLTRQYHMAFPDCEFMDSAAAEKEVPIQEQVLILHYLMAEPPPDISGKWVAYREIPGASFYFSAFTKRAIDPLKSVFGTAIDGFKTASHRLNGISSDAGDAAFIFQPFPKTPLQIILYAGDDEFPPEATILFDQTIEKILSPEDIAWLAGMVVYRLIGIHYG